MATVKDILDKKGSQVFTVGKDTTVLQAVVIMNEHKIGSLVVTEGERMAGMFTERDVLRRVVGEQRSPAETTVADVMTTEVACCALETPIDDARAALRDRRIRHLPVLDQEGRLLGMVSIGDLNAYDAANQEQTIFMMHEYLHGRM